MRASANLLVLASLLLGLPTVFAQTTWTGGASSDAWCDAANWDAGVPTASTDAFVRGGASVYPEIDGTESCTVEARTLDINDDNSGGWLTVTDGTLDVLTLLYTKNTAGNTGLRLEGGQIAAAGMDLHGDHSGRFTGGELVFDGSNTATRFLGPFRPNGTLVRFAGGGPLAPTVYFGSAGTGPGQSFFEDLAVEGVGLVIKSVNGGNNGPAWVTETLTLTSGTLTGGNIHYATTLPVISGGTYNVGSTHFHGTRTLSSGQSYLLPFGNLYVNDNGTAGGQIIVTGGTLDLPGTLYTYADNNGGIALTAGQIAAAGMDLHGDHSGRFTGGELVFDGSNTATRFLGPFRPNGTLVRFAGGGPLAPTVYFGSAGTGPGQSFFEDLAVEGVGLVIKSVNGGNNGPAWVTETLTLTSGTLTGGNIHYATTLPVISGGTYNVGSTHFHGTRTLSSGQSYLLPFGNLYVNDNGTAGGQIIVTGGTLDLPGTLYTYADNNGGIALTAGQIAAAGMDLHGDHSGRFTGGELVFDGSNTATRFLGPFRPNGTLVRFAGGGPLAPTVYFGSAGTGPGQSFFEDLAVEGVGLVIKSVNGGNNGPAWVTETLTLTGGTLTGGTISGKPRLVSPASVGADPILRLAPFTVSGLNVNGLEVQSSGRLIFEGGGCIRLDNTTFSIFSSTEPRLMIRHPGGNLEFNNLSFDTNPNNIHLAAEDTAPGNAYRLNLHVVNPTPNTATEGMNYTETGGSEVLWDGPVLAPLPVTLLLEAADAPPIVVPDSGGALTYRATLTNTSPEPQTFEARIVAVLPNGSVFGPIQGPRTVRIPANQTIGPVSFTDNVPAIAPAGTYGVVLEGTTLCPEATPTPGGFSFEKESSDSTQTRTPSLTLLLEAWTGRKNTAWETAPSEEATYGADETGGTVTASTEVALPEAFMLHMAYPNPFRGATTLRLDVPEASSVRVEIYDRLGRRVSVLRDGSLPAGEHALRFNAETLTAGLYIVRATDGAITLTQHLTLLR